MKRLIFIFLLSIFATVLPAQSNWQVMQTNTPIRKAFYVPNSEVGYATADINLILKTTNGGFNWFTLPANFSNSSFKSIYFINALTGWLGGDIDSETLLKTTNGGNNWTYLGQIATYFNTNYLKFFNDNTGYVYGTTTSVPKVCKTTNSGLNWMNINIPPSVYPNRFYALNENTIFLGTQLNEQYQLFKSTNDGVNWTSVLSGNTSTLSLINQIVFINENSGFVFGRSNSSKYFYTTNGGNNWIERTFSVNASELNYFHYFSPQESYVMSGTSIYKSTNSGMNWNPYSTVPIFYQYIQTVTMSDKNYWILGFGYEVSPKTPPNGMAYSYDKGKEWWSYYHTSGSEFRATYFLNDYTGWFVGDDGDVYKTYDGGDIVTKTYKTLPNNTFLSGIDFSDSQTGWVVGGFTVPYVLKSTDQGNVWNEVSSFAGTDESLISVDFTDTQNGLVASIVHQLGRGRIYKTTNAGVNWTSSDIPSFLLHSLFSQNINTSWTCGSFSNSGILYKSTNGGLNWQLNFQTDSSYFNKVKFVNDNTGYVAGYRNGRGCLFRTTNGGTNWTDISKSNSSPIKSFDAKNNGFIITVSAYSSYMQSNELINISTNYGNNWLNVNRQLVVDFNDVVFTSANTGYIVGTSGTILKTTDGGTVNIFSNSEIIDKEYELYQNYPNPFNPETTISFKLNKQERVTLIIYDILGKEVTRLVNNEIKNSGIHKISLRSEDFASGIYFYKLITDNFSDSKKMVFLK